MTCSRKIGPFDCCSVVQGDCLELMKQLPDGCVDAVITDPPYGVGKAAWDSLAYFYHVLAESGSYIGRVLHASGVAAIFSPTRYLKTVINAVDVPYRWQFIWYSSNNMQHGDIGFQKYTPVLIFSHRSSIYADVQDLRDYPAGTSELRNLGQVHPTPKPLELMSYLVDAFTRREDDIVLDGFSGTGSTLVAAKKLGRHFLGFEISEAYCQIARERLARIDAQPNLFQPKAEQLQLA